MLEANSHLAERDHPADAAHPVKGTVEMAGPAVRSVALVLSRRANS